MKKLFLLFSLITFSVSANAADTYRFDPKHTNITWSANHFGFSKPSGKFVESEGMVVLDDQNASRSKVEIIIKTTSISTGLPEFDNHLKGVNFFNVEKFPTAAFASTQVITQGLNMVVVTGNLTLLGVTKPVVLDVRLNKLALNPFSQKKTAGFSAKATIKRSEFGMNFGIPGISDEVKINIEAEAILSTTDNNGSNQVKLPQSNKQDANPWTIVQEGSKIDFKATQDSSEIPGTFKKFEGNIIFNPDKLSASKITMIVDTSSVAVSFTDSIEIIKNATWLATTQFPKATFTTNMITRISDTAYVASGILTIKGKATPISINFSFPEYSETMGKATATGSFTIKRSDFNIGDRDIKKANGVREDVVINFTIKAQK